MMINNAMVKDLDLRTLHLHLNQAPMMMILRSSRILPDKANASSLSRGLIPAGKNSKEKDRLRSKLTKHIEEANQSRQPTAKIVESSAVQQPTGKAMSNAQRIDQVIFELIETERSYVKVSERFTIASHRARLAIAQLIPFQDIEQLLERYIEALRKTTNFLPTDAIELLHNSVQSIHRLQFTFLERLQSSLCTQVFITTSVSRH